MPLANPYAKYQQTAIHTADRGDLLIMTYEAVLRWLGRADEAIDAGKVPEAHDALVAAQELVRNLAGSLDLERGGDIARNLNALYDYIHIQLVQANVQKSKEAIAAVRDLVAPLLDAWRGAVHTARKQGGIAAI